MSEKINQQFFLEKLFLAYPKNKIKIIKWNGYTKSLTFKCDLCEEEHTVSDARQLLNKKTYCQKNALNNKKWGIDEYSSRVSLLHGEKICFLEYNGLSNPVTYYCPRCGEIKKCAPARTLITRTSLCDNCYGTEKNIIERKIKALFQESDKYELISWRGVKNKLTEKCLSCGSIYDRRPSSVLQCFDSCPFCNRGVDKQKLGITEIQKRLDENFGEKHYKILDYTGQLKKNNKIKCLDCGLIFTTHIASFINSSRGCPKCKRYKSKGEQKVSKYLEENNIVFEAQKRFSDCNKGLSSFDFCAYDDTDRMFLIEVNGIQHYKQTGRFDDLEIIQKRDKIKIEYCKEHNIPLIIIPYYKLTDKGIDFFLSFLKGSTTIPRGSKEQVSGS